MMLRAAAVPGSNSTVISAQIVPSCLSTGSVKKNFAYASTGTVPPELPVSWPAWVAAWQLMIAPTNIRRSGSSDSVEEPPA